MRPAGTYRITASLAGRQIRPNNTKAANGLSTIATSHVIATF
jgi:hypothetical protein